MIKRCWFLGLHPWAAPNLARFCNEQLSNARIVRLRPDARALHRIDAYALPDLAALPNLERVLRAVQFNNLIVDVRHIPQPPERSISFLATLAPLWIALVGVDRLRYSRRITVAVTINDATVTLRYPLPYAARLPTGFLD